MSAASLNHPRVVTDSTAAILHQLSDFKRGLPNSWSGLQTRSRQKLTYHAIKSLLDAHDLIHTAYLFIILFLRWAAEHSTTDE